MKLEPIPVGDIGPKRFYDNEGLKVLPKVSGGKRFFADSRQFQLKVFRADPICIGIGRGNKPSRNREQKPMTDNEKYREMIRLYQLPYHEKDALELARELMTSNLPKSKMKDVEHVYEMCGGK